MINYFLLRREVLLMSDLLCVRLCRL